MHFVNFRHLWFPKSLIKSLVKFVVLSLFLLPTSSLIAFELGIGLASVEEGDDRLRPGVGLHLGFTPNYYSRIFVYGREFGPVKETTLTVSANRRFSLFNSQNIKAGMGVAILREHYEITYSKAEDQKHNRDDEQLNLGLSTGLFYELPFAQKYFFSAGWESAIFVAGPNGFFFLSSGRKQYISVLVGMNI